MFARENGIAPHEVTSNLCSGGPNIVSWQLWHFCLAEYYFAMTLKSGLVVVHGYSTGSGTSGVMAYEYVISFSVVYSRKIIAKVPMSTGL